MSLSAFNSLTETAASLYASNLSVIPCDPELKHPNFSYSEWMGQNRFPVGHVFPKNTRAKTPIDCFLWFNHVDSAIDLFEQAGGICLVNGYSDVETLDFDHNGYFWDLFLRSAKEKGLWHFIQDCYCETTQTPGNHHLIYKVRGGVDKSQKLALVSDGKVGIETRGTGSITVIAPTPGYRVAYGDITDLPILSKRNHQQLMSLCRSLSEIKKKQYSPRDTKFPDVSSKYQIEDVGAEAEMMRKINYSQLLLEENGWSVVKEATCTMNDGSTNNLLYLQNKNQHNSYGGSLFDEEHKRLFTCFTTNADPLVSGESYTPIDLYTTLRTGKHCSINTEQNERRKLIAKGVELFRDEMKRAKQEQEKESISI